MFITEFKKFDPENFKETHLEEIPNKKHKGNTFCPWVTPKHPPGCSDEILLNSKCATFHSPDPRRKT